MTKALPADHPPTPIEVQDELWLNMDRPNNLMIIDSLIVLREAPDWDAVQDAISQRMIQRYPIFRCRPDQSGSSSHWVRDEHFSLSRHIIPVRPSEPLTRQELQSYVSSQRSKPFDRDHPLWVVHFIDDVERTDGTLGAAVLLRVHHSVADGIRMTELALSLCDPIDTASKATISADVGRQLPKPGLPTVTSAMHAVESVVDAGQAGVASVRTGITEVGRAAGGAIARDLRDPLGAPGRAASSIADLAGAATREIVALVTTPDKTVDLISYVSGLAPGGRETTNTAAEVVGTLTAKNPHSVWTGSPGVEKQVAWSEPIPLKQVREIARSCGATINDTLIGLMAGALMNYLAEHDTSLDDVGWLLPVSLQPFGQGAPERLGNHLALVNFRMPLNIKDPRRRLQEINRRTQRIKHSQETLITFGVQRIIAQAPHTVSVMLTNFFANVTVGVLTNVPGPREPVALAGTPVDAMLGWAPSSGDQPMTVCIYSYAGQVFVSIGADAGLIPDADRMIELLHDEVEAVHAELHH